MNDFRPVLDWLIDGAPSDARSEDVLATLCQRLIECGMPLWRVAVFVRMWWAGDFSGPPHQG
jgi:adenylate cyclase